MTGDFIDGSTATGVLVIVSNPDIFYHLIKRESSHLHVDSTIPGVVGGKHSISFFVVEENGLPFNRIASMPKVVDVQNGKNMAIVITCTKTLAGQPIHKRGREEGSGA